ncbi:MAG: response regulator [Candidatus Staskawiczbacteria bacterium]|nr:response regulator [Candidatus Staskawiczbacteria bacterium]MBI3337025.1 response regulator [Candidatus Staskawiczbacteria bacterium]
MTISKSKVFLIEDELDIMFLYKSALKAADIDVEGIPTGKEAMEKVKEVQEGKREKPSLVLLDLVLPDINGLDILNALKKNEKTKDIAVFILSNYSSEALRNISYIKPDKFFVKAEITPNKLADIVKNQLK